MIKREQSPPFGEKPHNNERMERLSQEKIKKYTEEISTFLNLFINNDENAGCFWDPNTREVFRKNLKVSEKKYLRWEIEKVTSIDKVLFYFIALCTFEFKIEKKIFCLGANNRKKYIAYPVNFLEALIDKTQLKKIALYKCNVYVDYSLYELYGEKSMRERFEHQEQFLGKLRLDLTANFINIYWFPSNNALRLITKRSMFVEPTSESIFIFLDQVNDDFLSHEIIHCIFWSSLKKWPSLLFREGSAEAFFPLEYYKHRKFDYGSLEKIILNDRFDNMEGENCAILLGLFCRFLIEEYGLNKFIEAYRLDGYDSKTVLWIIYNMNYNDAIERFDVWRLALRL